MRRINNTKGTVNFDKFERSFMKSRQDMTNMSELKYLLNIYSANSPESLKRNNLLRNSSLNMVRTMNEHSNNATRINEFQLRDQRQKLLTPSL